MATKPVTLGLQRSALSGRAAPGLAQPQVEEAAQQSAGRPAQDAASTLRGAAQLLVAHPAAQEVEGADGGADHQAGQHPADDQQQRQVAPVEQVLPGDAAEQPADAADGEARQHARGGARNLRSEKTHSASTRPSARATSAPRHSPLMPACRRGRRRRSAGRPPSRGPPPSRRTGHTSRRRGGTTYGLQIRTPKSEKISNLKFEIPNQCRARFGDWDFGFGIFFAISGFGFRISVEDGCLDLHRHRLRCPRAGLHRELVLPRHPRLDPPGDGAVAPLARGRGTGCVAAPSTSSNPSGSDSVTFSSPPP